jgi:hypothetical protein
MSLAQQTLQMALKAPGRDGAFKCFVVISANPGNVKWGAGDGSVDSVESGFLGFDMAWAGYWLLKWREAQLPGSPATLERCKRLAEFLLARQDADGMLPTRFDDNGAVQESRSRMVQAETAPVALFLLELYKNEPDRRYLAAARRGLAFLEREVIPDRKWYDFETFWSCSPRVVSFDERTHQWPANDLALIHAPAAYLAAYAITGEPRYRAVGEALLDYLCLYQQSWTNPVLEGLTGNSMLLGGFTTQNSDAEWSDARQSLAGTVLMDYYRATGKEEYLERGVSALRAQFPISPSENWAHEGYGPKAGISSFHWGSGSGLAGIEMEEDYLKDMVFDVASKRGVGVNGLNVKEVQVHDNQIAVTIESPFPWPRNPAAIFHQVKDGVYDISFNTHPLGRFSSKDLQKGIEIPSSALSVSSQLDR